MMEKEVALEVRRHAQNAITKLEAVLQASQGRCSHDVGEALLIGVERSIARIQTMLIDLTGRLCPELQDE